MYVFLSYPSEKRDVAGLIAQSLTNVGHKVFFDNDSLPPGGSYDERISIAIAKADAMVFLVNQRSLSPGSYTLTELKFARNRWPIPIGRVLPVMLEDIPIKDYPAYLKSMTLLQPEGNVVAETVAEIKRMAAAIAADEQATASFLKAGIARRSGLIVRVSVGLVAAAAMLYLGLRWSFLLGTWSQVSHPVVGAFQAPLTNKRRVDTNSTIDRLGLVVQNDLESDATITPWAAAQAILALPPGRLPKAGTFKDFVRANAEPECHCWQEVPHRDSDRCTFISGWMFAAMARLGIPATTGEIEFVLHEQNRDGWWAMFMAPSSDTYASPYATAWLLIGLHRQAELPGFSADMKDRMNRAIQGGVAWLLASRLPNTARWKLYPNSSTSDISLGISGVAMHALHLNGAAESATLDHLWLNSLPENALHSSKSSYIIVPTAKGQAIDHFDQLDMPWILAATVDAYASGSLNERIAAARWFDLALGDPLTLAIDADKHPWWRAEYLYAMRYAMQTPASAVSGQ